MDAVTPVWYNILNQKLVDEPVFSFWLSKNPQGQNGGEMTLGGIDQERYTGDMYVSTRVGGGVIISLNGILTLCVRARVVMGSTYFPLVSETYWAFNMTDFEVNGQAQNFCPNNECYAIADTGTSLIAGPTGTAPSLLRFECWLLPVGREREVQF